MNKDILMVSIKCWVYNHEPYLKQCLDGFVMQKTDFRFEAIVHDDASTDKSASIIREYAEKYPDIIKPILETENQYSKHDGSLQRIMDNACKGKYIAICEGDDYWTDPLKLQKQVNALESNPACSISFCKVQCVDKNGSALKWTIPTNGCFNRGVITLEMFAQIQFTHSWAFHTSSFMYRTSFLPEYQNAQKKILKNFPFGDLPLVLFFLTKGDGFYIDDLGSCYRQDSGGYNSYMKEHPQKVIEHGEKMILALNDFDKFTDYKYSKYIQHRVLVCKRGHDILNGDKYAYFRPKYWSILSFDSIARFLSSSTKDVSFLYNGLKKLYHFIKE